MLEHLTHTILLLSATASSSLVNAVAQGLCLAAIVALCLRLLPGIKPAARFVIWLSVLFTVLALHLESGTRSSTDASFAAGVPSFHLDPRWGIPIAAIWFAMSMGRAVALVRSALDLRRVAKSATPVVTGNEFQHLLKTRFRAAQLCTSTQVDRPSVAGFFHPRVLLPEDLLQKLSSQELEQIILHEMEHLRRFDDWTNLLQKVALVFFPLNPVLFWIEQRLCRERELACDDCVLSFTAARKSYATCLTSLAEHALVRRGITLALGAWEKQSELSRRVRRILDKPEVRLKPVTANVITGVVIAGLLGGAATLAHTPELVSFTPEAVANAIPSASIPASIVAATEAPESALPMRNLSPELVKAVVPDRQENIATHRPAPRHHTRVVKALHQTPEPQPPQQWVVLTRWQARAVPQRPVLAVSETGNSYAAVPVGNGWLIIQL
jgi:beta-lactamase regulating signal transducer with metallopeptidase domain